MNDMNKLTDDMLDEVTGGTKYYIKPALFVTVRDRPNGTPIATLGTVDFVVTDGQRVVVDGITWHHVYFASGDGYIAGYEMGNLNM